MVGGHNVEIRQINVVPKDNLNFSSSAFSCLPQACTFFIFSEDNIAVRRISGGLCFQKAIQFEENR